MLNCIPAIFSRLTVSWRCTRMIRMKMTQLKLEASDAGGHLQKVGLRVEAKLILLQRQIYIVLFILYAYRESYCVVSSKTNSNVANDVIASNNMSTSIKTFLSCAHFAFCVCCIIPFIAFSASFFCNVFTFLLSTVLEMIWRAMVHQPLPFQAAITLGGIAEVRQQRSLWNITTENYQTAA